MSDIIEVPRLFPYLQRGFEPAPMSTASLLPPLCLSTLRVGAVQSVVPEPVAGEGFPSWPGGTAEFWLAEQLVKRQTRCVIRPESCPYCAPSLSNMEEMF